MECSYQKYKWYGLATFPAYRGRGDLFVIQSEYYQPPRMLVDGGEGVTCLYLIYTANLKEMHNVRVRVHIILFTKFSFG